MSDAPPTPREGFSSRLRAALRRRHWKDAVIAVLALLLVSMSAYAFRERIAAAAPWLGKLGIGGPDGEPVAVFDVVLDRAGRAHVDILFDRPLGEGRVDEVLEQAPATLSPPLGGFWKWQDTNALRFQPSGGFPMASRYTVALIPERILQPGQVFSGETELEVVTDRFLVEAVDLLEEPAVEGKGQVIFRGTLRFNYPVNPELLATKVRLVDPESDQPLAVTLETSWAAPEIGFQTAAVQKRPEERSVRLVIAGDLTPAEGNVALGEDYVQEIPLGSSEKLTVRGVETEPGDQESTIRVRFSSPVSAAVAEKYVRFEPAVRYRSSADRNLLSLTGPFKPGSAYKLTIAQGMPATDDAVLREEHRADVRLPDLAPRAGFQSQGMFLSASGGHAVALETVNVDRVQMTVDRVYLNNLFFLFQYGGFFEGETTYTGGGLQHAFGSRVAEQSLAVRGRKNQRVQTLLDLDRHVAGLGSPHGRGLYRVVVSRPGEYEGRQRWLLLTDLGVVAKRGEGELLVWVSSFRDLAAVAGARVTLVSDQNQPLAAGTTDGEGLLRLRDEALRTPKPTDRQPPRPYMLTVEKGDDFTFLLFDTMRIDPAGLEVGGAASLPSGYQAFLYGERDIYRPGETVEGLAVVRDASLQAPPPQPLLLRWRDPQGRERGTERVASDERGLAPFALAVPAYALTGPHTLELVAGEEVIGQYRFQVEEFVPDRIKVEIAPPASRSRAGSGWSMRPSRPRATRNSPSATPGASSTTARSSPRRGRSTRRGGRASR
jgi:hypothetical protein